MIFRHFIPTKVVFGKKSVQKLKSEIESLGLDLSKIAIICGKSAVSYGYVDILLKQLSGKVEIFDLVEPDPTVEVAYRVLEEVNKFSPTLIVALGGGSSIDVAKVVSVMLKNEGAIEEYIGVPEGFKNQGIPLVAVPTTSGSGSEVTPYAVLTDKEKLRKAPLISRFLFPVLAIDDPELTISKSSVLTANTGVDALTHAIESFLSKRATPVSKLYSLKAISLIYRYLPRCYGNPFDVEAREKVMLGSLLGGMAIADAGAGLVHTLAHILGVLYNVPHGLANGVFLVPVLSFYGLSAKEEIEEIGKAMEVNGGFEEVLKKLREFLTFLGIPEKLRDLGVVKTDVHNFVAMAMEKKHLMNNLPRIPNEGDIRRIVEGGL